MRALDNLNWKSFASRLGLANDKLDAYQQDVVRYLTNDKKILPLFEGVPELLSALRQSDKELFIASNNMAPYILRTLEHYQIPNPFTMILGLEMNMSKAEKIAAILETFHYSVEGAVMIGDGVNDIEGANEAWKVLGLSNQKTVNSIAVTYGFQTHEKLAKKHPSLIVRSPEELGCLLLG